MKQVEERWRETERRSFDKYLQRDLAGAIRILASYLEEDSSSPYCARALGNRAEFYLEAGNVAEAERDLRRALEIEDSSTYTRYTLEFALGALLEDGGDAPAASGAYLQALKTALAEGNTVSAAVVLRLSRLTLIEPMPGEVLEVVERSLVRSWEILDMSGKPDLSSPEKTAELLLREASRVK